MPAIVWLTFGGLVRLLGERRRLGEIWRTLALPMAVVVAASHASKGLAKFVSWAPFLPGALRDPDGINTAQAITAKTLPGPVALLSTAE